METDRRREPDPEHDPRTSPPQARAFARRIDCARRGDIGQGPRQEASPRGGGRPNDPPETE